MVIAMGQKIVLLGEAMGLFTALEPGELSSVEGFTASIAGAEYNVAVGLSRLGHKAAYCTKLGFDPMGERILQGMEKNKISTSLVLRSKEHNTGFMLKGVNPQGDPAIAYYRKNSAASTIGPRDIDGLDLYGCGHLHLTGIFPAVSQSALAAVKRLLQRVKALDMTVSFDPNLRPQLWESEKLMCQTLNSLAESADTVLPGIKEGAKLTGKNEPNEIAEFYHKTGVKNVVIKLGEKGAYYSSNTGENGIVPAFPVTKIVDTVGAGDGFAAGVISALMEGLSLKEAAFRGTVIGSAQLTKRGDNEGLPTKRRMETMIERGKAN